MNEVKKFIAMKFFMTLVLVLMWFVWSIVGLENAISVLTLCIASLCCDLYVYYSLFWEDK